MKPERLFSQLPIELRLADVCPTCGLHAVLDVGDRLRVMAEGGDIKCCGMQRSLSPNVLLSELLSRAEDHEETGE